MEGLGPLTRTLFKGQLYIPSLLQSTQPHWPSKQTFWGFVLLMQDLWTGELDVGLGPFAPWGEPLQL